MRCPFCGSTDVADLVDKTPGKNPKDAVCLDCEGAWKRGGRKHRRSINSQTREYLLQ